MTAFAGRNKRTVLLLADLNGPEVGHLRSEAKRRFDLGFVHRKDVDNIKIADLSMVTALIRVAYYSDRSLKWLNSVAEEYGPISSYAFDYDFSEKKAISCQKLTFVKYRKYSRNPELMLELFNEISHDIKDAVGKSSQDTSGKSTQFRALGHRIQNAATAIRAFNLNSTSHVVADLEDIADQLLSTGGSELKRSDIRYEAKRALFAIGNLYDHIESSWMARIIVSGAVTAFITDVGWPAVFCQTIQLASWHGKDAFMNAVFRLPSLAGGGRKPPKKLNGSISVDN